MHDDELMDRLLRDAMAGEMPRLSSAFEERVRRRAHPRSLTPMRRLVIVVYAFLATAAAAWLLRDLPVTTIAASLVIGVPAAAGASAYGRRVAFGQ